MDPVRRKQRLRVMIHLMNEVEYFVCGAILLLAVYAAIAMGAFSLRHPEYTQAQVLYHFWDAVLWR